MLVLLQDGTAGQTRKGAKARDTVTVRLNDENGLPIEVEGVISEILDEQELD